MYNVGSVFKGGDQKLVAFTKNKLENDYQQLIIDAVNKMNQEHNYILAYDLATQAKFIATNYLEDELLNIECECVRGMAYLGIDSIVGHDMIERLYFDSKHKLKDNQEHFTRLELALGSSKRIIGEYDQAIQIFGDISKYSQRKIELKQNQDEEISEDMRIIIRCYLEIACCLIYKSQQRNYYSRVKKIEEKLKSFSNDQIDRVKDLAKYLEVPNYSEEINNDLVEAERYLKEALLMSRERNFRDLELYGLLDYACVLIEKEEFNPALEILVKIKDEEFTRERLFGYVMDEIGVIYIHQERYEEAKEIFDLAWNWLCKHNDVNEMSRNCYGTALYFFKKGNLDLAYAFAELGYKKDLNLPCLKLLYEVCLLKYLRAQRLGNESEYAFYRSEYDRYKLQLERRG